MLPGVLAVGKVVQAEPELKQLRTACDGMESSFLKQMLTVMHQTVQETKLGGDDTGEDTYKDMMDNAVADKLAGRGTLGISKMVFRATAPKALDQATKRKAAETMRTETKR